jgi:hypothetical protein
VFKTAQDVLNIINRTQCDYFYFRCGVTHFSALLKFCSDLLIFLAILNNLSVPSSWLRGQNYLTLHFENIVLLNVGKNYCAQ